MRYPSIGETVRVGDEDPRPWTVKGITERGDVILRGPRKDELLQAPVEAIRVHACHGVHSCDCPKCITGVACCREGKLKRDGYRAPWEES